jgi:uncharacterized protein (TIGR02996 family)
MTHDDAFFQAIIENPDDDTPRLVYADWLEEHGQPDRATFIRVQCALAHLPDDAPQRKGLEAREGELLGAHRAEWERPLRRLLPGMVANIHFRRGFVEKAFVESRAFRVHAEELFRLAPLRHLGLYMTGSRVAPFPNLAFVNRLVGQLAGLPQLGGLATLDLGLMSVGDEGTTALSSSPHLGGLTALRLGDNSVGDWGVGALATSAGLPHLAILDLSGNRVTDAGALALAGSAHFGRLKSLDLRVNPIGPQGREALRARFGDRVHL